PDVVLADVIEPFQAVQLALGGVNEIFFDQAIRRPRLVLAAREKRPLPATRVVVATEPIELRFHRPTSSLSRPNISRSTAASMIASRSTGSSRPSASKTSFSMPPRM